MIPADEGAVVGPHRDSVPAEPDTIVAIATPPGRGGIGVVRLSGPEAVAIALPLLDGLSRPLEPRQARFCQIRDPESGNCLDEAVVIWFRAPRSYTGEDVVEIAAHGSPVLLNHLLQLLLSAGARLARPGEFTERAFFSGRLDLAQAEAVRDLIDAQTVEAAQVAAQQLGGALSRALTPAKEALVALIATLEAGIDFAEDDTPVLSSTVVAERIDKVVAQLETLERSFTQGRLLREGIRLAIIGRPNVGKSSLFNRLLGHSRSIVTDEPGTTRDTVGEHLSIGGIPVELVDTAGLREGAGEAERLGIEKSREALADAGLVLLVLDATAGVGPQEQELLRTAVHRPLVIAWNKSDRVREPTPSGSLPPARAEQSADFPELRRELDALAPGVPAVSTSALTGAGIATLREALRSRIAGEQSINPEAAMLTNLRQHTAVIASLTALAAARAGVASHTPHEMLLLDLYGALREVDSLTGATTTEDILHKIFSTFCIGK